MLCMKFIRSGFMKKDNALLCYRTIIYLIRTLFTLCGAAIAADGTRSGSDRGRQQDDGDFRRIGA